MTVDEGLPGRVALFRMRRPILIGSVDLEIYTGYVERISGVDEMPVAKNITLAIDEDLLDKARVLAAMRRTSVNAMVRDFLEKEIGRETRQASRAELWGRLFDSADLAGNGARSDGGHLASRLDREPLYEEVMRERGLL